jgi:hypothetical protein
MGVVHIVQTLSFLLRQVFDAAVKDKAEESAKALSGALRSLRIQNERRR